MKKYIFLVLIFTFIFQFNSTAFADFFNNRNILPGGRSALMGGAYTALSEDVSGT